MSFNCASGSMFLMTLNYRNKYLLILFVYFGIKWQSVKKKRFHFRQIDALWIVKWHILCQGAAPKHLQHLWRWGFLSQTPGPLAADRRRAVHFPPGFSPGTPTAAPPATCWWNWWGLRLTPRTSSGNWASRRPSRGSTSTKMLVQFYTVIVKSILIHQTHEQITCC